MTTANLTNVFKHVYQLIDGASVSHVPLSLLERVLLLCFWRMTICMKSMKDGISSLYHVFRAKIEGMKEYFQENHPSFSGSFVIAFCVASLGKTRIVWCGSLGENTSSNSRKKILAKPSSL